MQDNIIFHEATPVIDGDEAENKIFIKHEQYIPDDFMSDLRNERDGNAKVRSGNFMHVASIPEATVYELKNRYNFDVLVEPVRETLKMLRRLELDNFIATNKRV